MIEQCTFAEIEVDPNFPGLLVEYAAESGIKGMPAPQIEPETYRRLEAAGLLTIFAARAGGRLIGFIFVLATVLPHYAKLIAVSESFFVAKAHRMSGAGVKLLKAAEDRARELGAAGPLVSAPTGGHLAEVMPRLGYVETNRVFFKAPYDA